MKMELWEVADKATILRIKFEKGLDCKNQYRRFVRAVQKVDEDLLENLYKINKEMFELEDEISKYIDVEPKDFYQIGVLYDKLRAGTHARTVAKNAIAAKYKEFGEVKKY